MATKTFDTKPVAGDKSIARKSSSSDGQNHSRNDDDRNDKEVEEIMMLNLYNFDEDNAQNCRYVLTSPRSLEACSRHGIKPTELLYKSLSEVEIQCKEADPNLSYSQIYTSYQDMEMERRRKLKICREERERMLWQANETIVSNMEAASQEELKELEGQVKKAQDYTILRRYSNDELEKIVNEFRSKPLSRSEQDDEEVTAKATAKATAKMKTKPKMKKRFVRDLSSKGLKNSEKIPKDLDLGIPQRDRKIMELMLNRHREERENDRIKKLANLSWEQRKKNLYEMEKLKLNQKKDEIKANNRARLAMQEKQKAKVNYEAELERKYKIQKLQEKDAKWAAITSNKQILLQQQLQLKALQDQSKKKNQEYNLRMEDEYRNANVIQNHLRNLRIEESAKINRQIRNHEEKLRVGAINLKSKLLHDKKKYDNEVKERENQEHLKNYIEMKHLRADANYKQQQQIKAEEIQAEIMKIQRQFRKQQEAARLIDEEHDEWLRRVQLDEELRFQKAEVNAAMAKEEKRYRAKEQREARQAGYNMNMKKIKEEEQLKKRYMSAQVLNKDRKRQEIAQAKEENLIKSRDMARTTSLMRHKLKEMTAKSSFDKIATIPKQYASIEGRDW